jgi:hypothetical protein
MKNIEIVTIAFNGSLYAIVGIIIHLGLFTPVIRVVRFLQEVVVPAIFYILFDSFIRGSRAAIGIFKSDMVVHGDPLLSLTVGDTVNLFCMKGLKKSINVWG